jgi:hypothetical protein
MRTLVIASGVVQLGIVGASLLVPLVLRWREEVARLTPLTRGVFWTYSGYIVGTNLALALVSLFLPDALLGAGPLPVAVAAYGALYWGVRVVLQVACYRRHAPKGRLYALADAVFSLAFAFAAVVFALAGVGWR